MRKSTKNAYIEFLETIEFRHLIYEKEISRIKNLLNNSIDKYEYMLLTEDFDFRNYDLTEEQIAKGYFYLIKKYLIKDKTKLRKNKLPFGMQQIILNKHFTFEFGGFAKLSNGIWNYYTPIYIIFDKSDLSRRIHYFNFCGYDFEVPETGKLICSNIYFVERI